MIIDFDRNPALSEEQRLQSLMESVQLALNELYDKTSELMKKIGGLSASDVDATTPMIVLDTTASTGTTDGDLYAAITALGWASDVIE